MAYSEARSSSDAARATRGDCQVYLSFRGPHICRRFTNPLYHQYRRFTDTFYHRLMDAGVRVFRDDELRVGEVIGENFLNAVNNSVLYIPIFSPGYAACKRCLRELTQIVDTVSKSKGKKSIIPIYFGVNPEDIKLETPIYSDALRVLAREFPDEIEAWRAALKEVDERKGWNLKMGQSHAAISKSVVRVVLEKLNIKQNEHLVGLDDQIKDLTELLDVDHPDVRIIGIYGMGGIGKTTIAKVIFNQLCPHFEKCCNFLEDVRERSSTEDGIVPLQQKLLSDIGDFGSAEKINDSKKGMRRIGETFSNKKVLLVLDDVAEKVHIKNLIANSKLHGGSRIIITTRNRAILQVEEFEITPWEMQTMNDVLALKLFCWHAFDIDFPPNDYRELSRKIVSYTGGLPLAIEATGSFFKGKNKEFWTEILVKLMEMEVSDERMQKMEDEAGRPPADMETSDRNYAIAAVQNVVGIDGRVKQITDFLDDEVRILGIFGADGIGKMTLAKAVYDCISSCFEGHSFLAEVEETTQDPSGIQVLQTRLIRNILERDREDPSFDERRIEDFLDIFRERKVLLVVNDVEKKSHLHAIVGDQLNRFGPGSRIIVTSQNEEILKEYDPEKARTYLVSALEDGQAFELFCMHAFRMQSSIPDYDGLANRIVKATEKLPLAVEVVGSFLRGKSIQEWAKMEKSMKERTRSSAKTTVGPEEILDICYRELDQKQKHIFLDIAGFIYGGDARIASYMWPNCDLPSSGCILMPLAKTGENNELQMHRLLRCLGKRICKEDESQDPRSRRFCWLGHSYMEEAQ